MNDLYFVVTSSLKNCNDIKRMIQSVDISEKVHIVFINQNDKSLTLNKLIEVKRCSVKEIFVNKVIPLSSARNEGLKYLYSLKDLNDNALVMFTDDDAWFPYETIDYLLNTDIRGFSLKTIDPIKNKAFSKVKKTSGEIKGYHLVKDIVSICLVVPAKNLVNLKLFFNEKLGLGNKISQGEESLFIYRLHKHGIKFFYDTHLVYHPYKKNFNMKNFYSMSYFWALGLSHISIIFLWPTIKYLIKYTAALLLYFKDRRYFAIFRNVWNGFIDGVIDKEKVL